MGGGMKIEFVIGRMGGDGEKVAEMAGNDLPFGDLYSIKSDKRRMKRCHALRKFAGAA